jgi:hypothetical protein
MKPSGLTMRSIALLGTVVAPKVRAEMAIDASSRHPL